MKPRKPRRLIHLFSLMTLIIILAGCGAGKTLVMRPPETELHVTSLSFSESNSTIRVPEETKQAFEKKLSALLYEESEKGEGAFQRGNDITIKYRFIQVNEGSQFTRWFWGGIGNAGEGSLTVEAKYFDNTDKELATIHAEGKIGSGFFGGSFEFAIEKAAEEIAEYTISNFK